jgi:hypothetical protein
MHRNEKYKKYNLLLTIASFHILIMAFIDLFLSIFRVLIFKI